MKQSNLYIFVYASVMVVVVAAVLALASTSLRPAQQKNIDTEKRLDILKSVGAAAEVASAPSKDVYVSDEYKKVIVDQYAVNVKGEKVDGVDVFRLDLKVELSKPANQRALPVYVASLSDGSTKYILPIRGRGLWGPIWGYISLNDDFNTIYGATFAHKGETPGLGAEISTPKFQNQFKGKTIFKDGKFVSVSVIKPGSAPLTSHSVDAISGGTITSKGLEEMLLDCLSGYQAFFTNQKN